MVETALLLPVVMLLISAAIDLGRYTYIRGVITARGRDAGRILSTSAAQTSDCAALRSVVSSQGDAILVTADPASLAAYQAPQTPPPGQGYVFIYPAVSVRSPQLVGTNCNAAPGTTRALYYGYYHYVNVTVRYSWVAWTPMVTNAVGPLTINAAALLPTGY